MLRAVRQIHEQSDIRSYDYKKCLNKRIRLGRDWETEIIKMHRRMKWFTYEVSTKRSLIFRVGNLMLDSSGHRSCMFHRRRIYRFNWRNMILNGFVHFVCFRIVHWNYYKYLSYLFLSLVLFVSPFLFLYLYTHILPFLVCITLHQPLTFLSQSFSHNKIISTLLIFGTCSNLFSNAQK